MNSPDKGISRAKSAARALCLLELLAERRDGLTFSEIATTMRLPKSSLHELLAVMTDRSFVEWEPSEKRFTLGIRTWECGQAYLAHRDLLAAARPIMQAISSEANETVQLAALDGVDVVYLERVDSTHPLRLQTSVGARVPAHLTALGKVLLADLREAELLQRFRDRTLARTTPNTVGTLAELLDELHLTRAIGFALDNEEYSVGLRCVAVPVRNHTGEAVAAISVSVPLIRGDETSLAAHVERLATGAGDVSRRLGCPEALAARTLADRAREPGGLPRLINELIERRTRRGHREPISLPETP